MHTADTSKTSACSIVMMVRKSSVAIAARYVIIRKLVGQNHRTHSAKLMAKGKPQASIENGLYGLPSFLGEGIRKAQPLNPEP